MREILLQHKVVGEVETVDAEILHLVCFIRHLAGHGLSTILDTLLNLAFLRVNLSQIKQRLCVAGLENV